MYEAALGEAQLHDRGTATVTHGERKPRVLDLHRGRGLESQCPDRADGPHRARPRDSHTGESAQEEQTRRGLQLRRELQHDAVVVVARGGSETGGLCRLCAGHSRELIAVDHGLGGASAEDERGDSP